MWTCTLFLVKFGCQTSLWTWTFSRHDAKCGRNRTGIPSSTRSMSACASRHRRIQTPTLCLTRSMWLQCERNRICILISASCVSIECGHPGTLVCALSKGFQERRCFLFPFACFHVLALIILFLVERAWRRIARLSATPSSCLCLRKKEPKVSVPQFYRIRDHFVGCWVANGWITCFWFMGCGDKSVKLSNSTKTNQLWSRKLFPKSQLLTQRRSRDIDVLSNVD